MKGGICMKRIITVLFIAVLLTAILAGCTKENTKEVSLNNYSDNFQISDKTSEEDSHVYIEYNGDKYYLYHYYSLGYNKKLTDIIDEKIGETVNIKSDKAEESALLTNLDSKDNLEVYTVKGMNSKYVLAAPSSIIYDDGLKTDFVILCYRSFDQNIGSGENALSMFDIEGNIEKITIMKEADPHFVTSDNIITVLSEDEVNEFIEGFKSLKATDNDVGDHHPCYIGTLSRLPDDTPTDMMVTLKNGYNFYFAKYNSNMIFFMGVMFEK